MVVLRGENTESPGEMAALPPDLTPFKVGAKGEWKGKAFEIVGRVRVGWEQGSWNEWCISMQGGELGWLAEAQGLLMVSFEAVPPEQIPADPSDYAEEAKLDLMRKRWSVDGVKRCVCLAAEGELPFTAVPGSPRVSVDLSRKSGEFASIELSETAPEFYSGEFSKFNDLRLRELRPVPGWDAEVAEEKNQTSSLTCPSCGSAVELRAAGQSMSAVCGSCGSVIDTATPEFAIIEKAEQVARRVRPLIPLGARGKLSGVEYEVIGYMDRSDESSQWGEYLLFNPWQGFTWLVYYGGHWNFVTRLNHVDDRGSTNLSYEGIDYKLFSSGKARVVDVIGEFYWKVKRGELANTYDYVSPPYMLSKEVYPELAEVTWSLGKYIPGAEIQSAFGLKDLPPPEGIYPDQPSPGRVTGSSVWRLVLWAVLALFCVEYGCSVMNPEKVINSSGFVFRRRAVAPRQVAGTPAEPVEILSTSRFQVSGGGRLVVKAEAGVDNSWLDLDLNLVNAVTNATTSAELEVSYYYGNDSGYWSEGSKTASVSFPNVTPGEYFLTIDPAADAKIETLPFTLVVQQGGLFLSNFFISLGMILLYPGFLLHASHAL